MRTVVAQPFSSLERCSIGLSQGFGWAYRGPSELSVSHSWGCLGCELRVIILLEGIHSARREGPEYSTAGFIMDNSVLYSVSVFPQTWLLLKNTPTAWCCHKHSSPLDGIWQLVSIAWFLPEMMLKIEHNQFNQYLIRPEKYIPLCAFNVSFIQNRFPFVHSVIKLRLESVREWVSWSPLLPRSFSHDCSVWPLAVRNQESCLFQMSSFENYCGYCPLGNLQCSLSQMCLDTSLPLSSAASTFNLMAWFSLRYALTAGRPFIQTAVCFFKSCTVNCIYHR